MRRLCIILSLFFICFISKLSAQIIPDRPIPIRHVNDFAHILARTEQDSLEIEFKKIYDTKKVDVIVIISDSLCGYSRKGFAKRIQKKWKIQMKKNTNTIFFFIKPTGEIGERYLMITVSKDLHAKVPDTKISEIADKDMIPYFLSKNYFEGLTKTSSSIIDAITK